MSYFEGFFVDGPLNDYVRDSSYGRVSLVGSRVVGWYRLPQPRAYYLYPQDASSGDDTDTARLATDCTAAADAEVDYRSYVGVNLVFQVSSEPPMALGGGQVLTRDGETRAWRMTFLPSVSLSQNPPSRVLGAAVVEHELGHAFGLPHSSSVYAATYDNAWDVMSRSGYGCSAIPERPEVYYGCPGQDTIAYHKDLLGWIPPGRKLTVTSGMTTTVRLQALERNGGLDPWLVVIPIDASLAHVYTLEVRQPIGLDRYLPGAGIVIHEVDPARTVFPAEVQDGDLDGDTGDAGALWTPGEVFWDAAHRIAVCVQSATDTGYQAVIGTSRNIACDAQPDFSHSVWSGPAGAPQAGQTVQLRMDVQNVGGVGHFVVVEVTPPTGTTYVAGSATTTTGGVTEDSAVTFALGSLPTGAGAQLSLELRLADTLHEATVLDLPIHIRWNGGSHVWPQRLLANPYPVFVPLLASHN